ncbi:hypothetical protein LEP1GSC050_1257 [Leptospira broomii serovar Hurstbridge str. 5399]|uniref:UPF0102 protein LEP1GSC050_1257 n=1 Tax=Leptospira broomii serovar Hurstbridge str. 5399 TaxID=1049789 RepID=T0F6X6_9LEPT|nr:YraN family protein [Leptospira broomii]EQA43277.1 hypothetical protein LEP1GSC050_1257 [Leptospira broomii serovar Hurstbridge str. 5399]
MRDLRGKQKKGKLGEDTAVNFLILSGHTILERNYRLRFAEIDIISVSGNLIFFTEVKYWNSSLFVHPLETFNKTKETKMKLAAEAYLSTHVSLRHCFVSFCLAFLNEKRELNFYRNLF